MVDLVDKILEDRCNAPTQHNKINKKFHLL